MMTDSPLAPLTDPGATGARKPAAVADAPPGGHDGFAQAWNASAPARPAPKATPDVPPEAGEDTALLMDPAIADLVEGTAPEEDLLAALKSLMDATIPTAPAPGTPVPAEAPPPEAEATEAAPAPLAADTLAPALPGATQSAPEKADAPQPTAAAQAPLAAPAVTQPGAPALAERAAPSAAPAPAATTATATPDQMQQLAAQIGPARAAPEESEKRLTETDRPARVGSETSLRAEPRAAMRPTATASPPPAYMAAAAQLSLTSADPKNLAKPPEDTLAALQNTATSSGFMTQSLAPSSPLAQTAGLGAPAVQAEQARAIAQQIVATATPISKGTTEITLSPAELGRIRMTVTDTDIGLAVTISADRPETADLMRRHMDQLDKQFAQAGLSDVAFSFAQHQQAKDQAEAAAEANEGPSGPLAQPGEAAPSGPGRYILSDSLDLRL